MNERVERFVYDDGIVRMFLLVTVLWGLVGMLVGLVIALQLVLPVLNFQTSWLSFGRLRPLHTNAVIFAFAGNAIFAGVYYSSQRLLKARMWSDALSRLHFWGWQAIIVAAAVTLPLGYSQSKEYAELEWPIDIAIAVIWVVFAANFFGTLARRRERHLYVALWFYIATIVAIAVLHIFNNLVVVAGPLKSYSIYAGVQDAFMQWWYGHNAVAFFLTTPFLGMMYYFLPKAAERPVYSYRLSILHFWSLVFIYIWAGPHHLHYTALPAWASTLGMLFSVMLWMPSWGGMINGLLTLRGAWSKVTEDPVLKFFVVAITFYGMSTFEGPLLSIKSVNALSHYTDWTIAHVHAGALGWVGFMVFGMIYWLLPRLFQTELWSKKLAELHFWIATIGILLYIVAIYAAGLTQGLMFRAFDESGRLAYPDFIETTVRLIPMYWVRVLGGGLYIAGMVLCAWNVLMTWRRAPAIYTEPMHEAPALAPAYPAEAAGGGFKHAAWHRRWEGMPLTFSIWVASRGSSSTTIRSCGARAASGPTFSASGASTPTSGTCATWTIRAPPRLNPSCPRTRGWRSGPSTSVRSRAGWRRRSRSACRTRPTRSRGQRSLPVSRGGRSRSRSPSRAGPRGSTRRVWSRSSRTSSVSARTSRRPRRRRARTDSGPKPGATRRRGADMSLSDVMSAFALQVFPEAGLVLFGAAFLVIAVTMCLRRNRTYFERARFLPLEEDGGARHEGEVTSHE